jgi:hypothetical protein
MNRALCLCVISLLAVACSASMPAQSTSQAASSLPPLPRSMAGYELYSWQSNDQWNFVLTTGTNRSKSVEEITKGKDATGDFVKLSATSIDGIKQHLQRLPKNEEIAWIGKKTREQFLVPAGPLVLPPAEIVDAIKAYCKQLGLNLHVSP